MLLPALQTLDIYCLSIPYFRATFTVRKPGIFHFVSSFYCSVYRAYCCVQNSYRYLRM